MAHPIEYYEARLNKALTNGKNSEAGGIVRKLRRKIQKFGK